MSLVNRKPSKPASTSSDWPPMTLSAAAAYLGRTEGALYQLVFQGRIPHFKPDGGRLYFRREDLDAYAFSGRIASNAEVEEEAQRILLETAARERRQGA